jgi:phosphoethanolamine N-methyltransferase
MPVKVEQFSEPGEYDEAMLALLQIIWGDGFLSPGGAAEITRVLEGVDIAGREVLDVGCGIGAVDLARRPGRLLAADARVFSTRRHHL